MRSLCTHPLFLIAILLIALTLGFSYALVIPLLFGFALALCASYLIGFLAYLIYRYVRPIPIEEIEEEES